MRHVRYFLIGLIVAVPAGLLMAVATFWPLVFFSVMLAGVTYVLGWLLDLTYRE